MCSYPQLLFFIDQECKWRIIIMSTQWLISHLYYSTNLALPVFIFYDLTYFQSPCPYSSPTSLITHLKNSRSISPVKQIPRLVKLFNFVPSDRRRVTVGKYCGSAWSTGGRRERAAPWSECVCACARRSTLGASRRRHAWRTWRRWTDPRNAGRAPPVARVTGSAKSLTDIV